MCVVCTEASLTLSFHLDLIVTLNLTFSVGEKDA